MVRDGAGEGVARRKARGRRLVPYFVPEGEEGPESGGGGGPRVNEGLVAFAVGPGRGGDAAEVVQVRQWKKEEGFFVDGGAGVVVDFGEGAGDEEGRREGKSSRGRGRGRGKGAPAARGGRKGVARKSGGKKSPAGRKEIREKPKGQPQTPDKVRFAGTTFEGASPSPVLLPVPKFALRAQAERLSRVSRPVDDLGSMSVDLRRLLKI